MARTVSHFMFLGVLAAHSLAEGDDVSMLQAKVNSKRWQKWKRGQGPIATIVKRKVEDLKIEGKYMMDDPYGGGTFYGPLGPSQYGFYLPPNRFGPDRGRLKMKGPSCPRWVSSMWPQAAFWSRQVLKRLDYREPGPVNASMANFTVKAAYLTCQIDLDPRSGGKFSEGNAKFYKEFLEAKKGPWYIPRIPHARDVGLVSSAACMQWVHAAWCDMGIWSRELAGRKNEVQDTSVCWDKVPMPRDFVMKGDSLPFAHDGVLQDYSQCQDHPFNKFILASICEAAMSRNPNSTPYWRNLVDNMPNERRDQRMACWEKLPMRGQIWNETASDYNKSPAWVIPEQVGLERM